MCASHRRSFLIGSGACLVSTGVATGQAVAKFRCPPCGCAMDGRAFDAPGTCPACGMTLVKAPTSRLPGPGALTPGRGAFMASGGRGREAKQIEVQYYRPAGLTPQSPILLVIPGSGRDAGGSRDAWIPAAEARGVLVAALGYPEADYDFAAYQMGGVIKDLVVRNAPVGPNGRPPDSQHLRDEDISFRFNGAQEEWLFRDFDRVFDILALAAGSVRRTYDLFGHSAGGQILHRLALFHPNSKADRVVAANAGLYTLPTLGEPLLFGLRDTGVSPASLGASFEKKLTLLLGGKDNDPERGGQHLHTPLADRQGLDRLSRGRTFFDTGRDQAKALGAAFNWTLEVVPGVGHDGEAMGRAAARMLYG